MAGHGYKRGMDFPNEGFVQQAIEAHFASLGFSRGRVRHADYAGHHLKTGERWLVEAKGLTSAVGLDFRTGIGQLLQGMSDEQSNHGLAVPDLPQFHRQVQAIPKWVRSALRLHWLFVCSDGSVIVDSPDQ